MQPVKRGIEYLLHHRWKTLLIFSRYSVLFSILLIMVVINLSLGRFIEDTQKAIGNAVYIPKVRDEGNGRRNNLGIFSDAEIEMLVALNGWKVGDTVKLGTTESGKSIV